MMDPGEAHIARDECEGEAARGEGNREHAALPRMREAHLFRTYRPNTRWKSICIHKYMWNFEFQATDSWIEKFKIITASQKTCFYISQKVHHSWDFSRACLMFKEMTVAGICRITCDVNALLEVGGVRMVLIRMLINDGNSQIHHDGALSANRRFKR